MSCVRTWSRPPRSGHRHARRLRRRRAGRLGVDLEPTVGGEAGAGVSLRRGRSRDVQAGRRPGAAGVEPHHAEERLRGRGSRSAPVRAGRRLRLPRGQPPAHRGWASSPSVGSRSSCDRSRTCRQWSFRTAWSCARRPSDREEEFRAVHNEAFGDHWGSTPVGPSEWQIDTTGHTVRADLSFITVEEDTDRVVAICLNHAYPEDDELTGRREAWIDTLGTLRDWRRRGVASAWYASSLSAFARGGLHPRLARGRQRQPDGGGRPLPGARVRAATAIDHAPDRGRAVVRCRRGERRCRPG